jgi:hypothetical protein
VRNPGIDARAKGQRRRIADDDAALVGDDGIAAFQRGEGTHGCQRFAKPLESRSQLSQMG